MRTVLAALAALTVTATAAPAFAVDTPPSPKQMELAKRLFADMQMDRTMRAMLVQMTPAMTEQMRKSNPSLTAEQAAVIGEATTEAMRDLMPRMIERFVPLYASTFTEKELQELVAFYEGPTGKAMLAKMPTLTSKMGPMMVELMPEVTADVQRRVCAKITCPAR